MDKDIYIWGTGCGAGELLEAGLSLDLVRGFVDSVYSQRSFMGLEVISPETLRDRNFGLVIVTSRKSEEILRSAQTLGLPSDKLLFLKNHERLTDLNSCYPKARELLGDKLTEELFPMSRIVREPSWSGKTALDAQDMENDYVRVKTLEAVCGELDTVPGAAAELGVYKGGFARCINALLPQRRLYLFDSFDGFDPAEAEKEREIGHIGAGFIQAHRYTSLSRVMSLMPNPNMVVPVPGLFPASLCGLEERFALVSVDVDLEQSIYAGLVYFVPRLSPGGYIFLHDYNSPRLVGVSAALRRYEAETGQKLPAVPLCDVNGSLVICG